MPISSATSSRSSSTDDRRVRGFSLVEMLVVLVVLSLAVGVIASRWTSGEASTAAIARQTESALRAARAQAMRSGDDVRVEFDLSARTIRRDGRALIVWPDAVDADIDAAGSESTPPVFAVRFAPGGGSTGLRITYRRDDAATSVAVSWLTGEVAREPR